MRKLTENEYKKAIIKGEKAVEAIPLAHNRKRTIAKNREQISAIKATTKRKRELSQSELVGKEVKIIYTTWENLGTKKWSHYYTAVKEAYGEKISRFTPCYVVTIDEYGYISKYALNKILAVVF